MQVLHKTYFQRGSRPAALVCKHIVVTKDLSKQLAILMPIFQTRNYGCGIKLEVFANTS